MSSHTPGPWSVATKAKHIAHNWHPVEANSRIIAWGLDGDTGETAEANARLIATAPKLLLVAKTLIPAAMIAAEMLASIEEHEKAEIIMLGVRMAEKIITDAEGEST